MKMTIGGTQLHTEEFEKPPVDLVLTLLAAGGLLL